MRMRSAQHFYMAFYLFVLDNVLNNYDLCALCGVNETMDGQGIGADLWLMREQMNSNGTFINSINKNK